VAHVGALSDVLPSLMLRSTRCWSALSPYRPRPLHCAKSPPFVTSDSRRCTIHLRILRSSTRSSCGLPRSSAM